jgi:hypothetical protein
VKSEEAAAMVDIGESAKLQTQELAHKVANITQQRLLYTFGCIAGLDLEYYIEWRRYSILEWMGLQCE